jgi:hypothetical protein
MPVRVHPAWPVPRIRARSPSALCPAKLVLPCWFFKLVLIGGLRPRAGPLPLGAAQPHAGSLVADSLPHLLHFQPHHPTSMPRSASDRSHAHSSNHMGAHAASLASATEPGALQVWTLAVAHSHVHASGPHA